MIVSGIVFIASTSFVSLTKHDNLAKYPLLASFSITSFVLQESICT